MRKKRNHWQVITALLVLLAFLLSACVGPMDPLTETEPTKPLMNQPTKNQYELIVVGGEPEGIAAAVAAARSGVDTLLLVKEAELGGLYTLGELNFIDFAETRQKKELVQGIFAEFSDAVGGSAFEIDDAIRVFHEMVANEPNLSIGMNTQVTSVIKNKDNQVTGVKTQSDTASKTYEASYVIDATADGDICALADVPFLYGSEDIGMTNENMGVTLVFRVENVNWPLLSAYLNAKRLKTNVIDRTYADMGAKGKTAWGFSKEGYAYEPQADNVRLRGPNMALQHNGDVLINALVLFDVDPLDEKSREAAKATGKKELAHILPYMQKNFVGFKHAALVDTADELYVRESRHIQCRDTLTIDDVLENRDQRDKIAVGNYPVDIQASRSLPHGNVIGYPDQYAIAYGMLVPQEVDGLLVVGRSAGYTSLAAGSARIVPIGMACAEAAGTSIALLKKNHWQPKDLIGNERGIQELQETLIANGANLKHHTTHDAVMDHWAYDGVKVLRRLGLVYGGHDNNYHLDEPMRFEQLQNLFNALVKRAGFDTEFYYVNDPVTKDELLRVTAQAVAGIGREPLIDATPATYEAFLTEKGILTAEIATHLSDDAPVTRGATYMLLANMYRYLVEELNGKALPAVPLRD